MPRRCEIHPRFPYLLAAQDFLIHRGQALAAGFTPRAIEYRLSTGQWQQLLPGVYLVAPGEASRRQMLIAAQLWAGPASAIDAADACRWHGLASLAVDDSVQVVVPWGDPARTTGFVVVRRTSAPIGASCSDRLRYVDAATAVIAATRRMTSERAVLAALSDAVQRRVVDYDDLVRANIEGPPKGARAADQALAFIGAGARSAPEADFLRLSAMSPLLPPPVCNALLRLPCGRLISPDAWYVDAGVIHETNGRRAHAREDLFDDMQDRHDVMTDAEFVVYHSSPRRLALHSREVIAQIERAVQRRAGFGVPRGVQIISMAA
jgi:hypothetical protein